MSSVDCVLGEWEDWSNCSKSCGGGNRSRSRPVETQEANGGNPCKVEDKSESEECNSQDCPIDCQWGPYGEWTDCTKSCEGGEKTRSRFKETSAENGGKECLGDALQTQKCKLRDCPGTTIFIDITMLQKLFTSFYDKDIK